MTINNIISAAAMVVVLGLAGGSAYADDNDSHFNDGSFTVLADNVEVANVPDHITNVLEIK